MPMLGIPLLGILVKHGRNTHYILCFSWTRSETPKQKRLEIFVYLHR